MDITITPGKLHGTVRAIPSKSFMHRYLICAAFADNPTMLNCGYTCDDVLATMDCLRALGAGIQQKENGYLVTPLQRIPSKVILNCRESGSTLRFLLPIVGALGIDATFLLTGNLSERPLSPLWEELQRMGCDLTRPDKNTISCKGQLQHGEYTIAGNVSSQFISGLLFAFALMDGESSLHIEGPLESIPYVDMTRSVLDQFNAEHVPFHSPLELTVEGDWSSAAYFLAAKRLGCELTIDGLKEESLQGDRAVTDYLNLLDQNCTVDLSDTPDLFPILAVAAAANHGATLTGLHRLRYKESDRINSVCAMLENLGIDATVASDTVTVHAGSFQGGVVDSFNDHRIAMAAAVAAIAANGPVTILNADCVSKSYPCFWEDYRNLGGVYAQYIR